LITISEWSRSEGHLLHKGWNPARSRWSLHSVFRGIDWILQGVHVSGLPPVAHVKDELGRMIHSRSKATTFFRILCARWWRGASTAMITHSECCWMQLLTKLLSRSLFPGSYEIWDELEFMRRCVNVCVV
jgi:hypothetical protein